jgi:uncharacterized protein (DUF58 family)
VSRSRIVPTKRAVALFGGALLLFAVGTNVQAGWVLAVAALLIGILIAGVLMPLRGLTGVTVTRAVPRTAVAGDRVPVTLGVENRSSGTRSLFRVTDDFCGRAFAIVGSLAPRQSRTYQADREGARRGVHRSGVCELQTGAPFGVLRVNKRVELESPIVVYPKTYDASAWRLRGPSAFPAPSSVGDVSSVRDYRPGDPLRHIHWRSVARRGRLVVREFDRETQATTAIVADVPSDPDVADAVASVACSIANAALRDGEVTLGGSRTRSSDAVLEWGARLAADGERSSAQLDGADRAEAVIYTGTASLAPVDRLRGVASSTSLNAVLITEADGDGADAVAAQLRGSGGQVAVLRPDEVEAWISGGCALS